MPLVTIQPGVKFPVKRKTPSSKFYEMLGIRNLTMFAVQSDPAQKTVKFTITFDVSGAIINENEEHNVDLTDFGHWEFIKNSKSEIGLQRNTGAEINEGVIRDQIDNKSFFTISKGKVGGGAGPSGKAAEKKKRR